MMATTFHAVSTFKFSHRVLMRYSYEAVLGTHFYKGGEGGCICWVIQICLEREPCT